jgi:hypothetical protein
MDAFLAAKIKAATEALEYSRLLKEQYNCHIDEKTGALVISKKKEKLTKKDKPIDNRFDILDL